MDSNYKNLKRVFAAILILSIIALSWYVLPQIIASINENTKLRDNQSFNITFARNLNNQIGNFENTEPDIVIDLSIRYKRGILIVGEPVEIFGKAILNQNSQNVHSLTMYFDNAQKWPLEQDNDGIMKGVDLLLHETDNTSRLIGNMTAVWTLEGTYHPLLAGVLHINKTHSRMIQPVYAQGVAITVYPKSEITQIETNNAILYLTIAIYFLTCLSSIPIILSLLGSNSFSQKNNDTRKDANNTTYVYNISSNSGTEYQSDNRSSKQHRKRRKH